MARIDKDLALFWRIYKVARQKVWKRRTTEIYQVAMIQRAVQDAWKPTNLKG
jgi:hypothetical protein